MRTQAGVKSIAMGGRPSTTSIQGIGGIKGAEILEWSDIYSYAQLALPQGDPEQQAILSKLTTLPLERSSANGINVRDNILPDNLNDGVPAQFIVEEADCRLYYTLGMVQDVTRLWGAAATAAWGGGSCISGGLAQYSPRENKLSSNSEPVARKESLPLFRKDSLSAKDSAWTARHGRKVIS